MKESSQRSGVMNSASSAASRTAEWSVAKREFADRVTSSGSISPSSGRPSRAVERSSATVSHDRGAAKRT
jgi:hypothetical protein